MKIVKQGDLFVYSSTSWSSEPKKVKVKKKKSLVRVVDLVIHVDAKSFSVLRTYVNTHETSEHTFSSDSFYADPRWKKF